MQTANTLMRRGGIETVRGRVMNYTNSDHAGGTYHRALIRRLWDAVLYGQRVEECLHMFIVRTGSPDPLSGGWVDVPVNVHGTISEGLALADNMVVEVTGRTKGGVLMAERVEIIGPRTTQVRFQRDLGEELSVFGPVAIVATILLASLVGGGFGLFVASWLFTSAAIGLAWAFLLSRLGVVAFLLLGGGRDGGPRFPLMAILMIGLLITIAFW